MGTDFGIERCWNYGTDWVAGIGENWARVCVVPVCDALSRSHTSFMGISPSPRGLRRSSGAVEIILMCFLNRV